MCGKLVAKAVADWVAQKWNSPTLLLSWWLRFRPYQEVVEQLPFIEAERSFNRIHGNSFRHPADILVECPTDKVEIAEYEGFLHVEANGNDVHSIQSRVLFDVVYIDLV